MTANGAGGPRPKAALANSATDDAREKQEDQGKLENGSSVSSTILTSPAPEPSAIARAAYKLTGLDEKFQFQARARVIDLGAAPGGWAQVAVKRGCARWSGWICFRWSRWPARFFQATFWSGNRRGADRRAGRGARHRAFGHGRQHHRPHPHGPNPHRRASPRRRRISR